MPRKGQAHTEDTKRRMSNAHKKLKGARGYTNADYVAAFEKAGSIQAAAKLLNVTRSCMQTALKRADVKTGKEELLGQLGGFKATKLPLPKHGEVKRYIVTAAQNNTQVNKTFWDRLQQLAGLYKAQIIVCPFTYSPITSRTEVEESSYDPLIQEHLSSDRIELAEGLVLCGEVTRTLPTAARPLSGYESYTGRKSSIFPHAKIALETVPSMKDESAKFMYTTGAITKHNYSRTKAGFKGEFHHAYGALIVEVTSGGWWVRQLNADSRNNIYDLDVCVDADGVWTGVSAAALVYGDFHAAEIDPEVLKATWGEDGLTNFLHPDQQILHDFFDMRSRPWQDEMNFHRQFEKHVKQQESVSGELDEAHTIYSQHVHRDWADSVFVRSNHDIKLEKWLNTGDYRRDLVNAEFFLEAQLAKVRAIKEDRSNFNVFEWAMRQRGLPDNVRFLKEDESYVICKNRGGGIECGQHGHLGANGAKGTPRGLAKMARKQFIGDKHSPCIVDGLYTVGTCTGRDVSYTRGPSSWSPTHGVAYENGKRALLTLWAGRFFAPREALYN